MPCSSRTPTPTTSWAWTTCGRSTSARGDDSHLRRARNHGRHTPLVPVHLRQRRRRNPTCRNWMRGTIAGAPFDVFGVEFQPMPILHGSQTIYGFRFGGRGLPHRSQRHSRGIHGAAARPGRAVPGRFALQTASHALHRGPLGEDRAGAGSRAALSSPTSATTWGTRAPRACCRPTSGWPTTGWNSPWGPLLDPCLDPCGSIAAWRRRLPISDPAL